MLVGPSNTVTFIASTPSNSTITVYPDEVPADGVSITTIVVTALDDDDGPISGASVTISAGGSCVVTPSGSQLTDSSGVAVFEATNTVVETVSFSANVDGTTVS